MSRERSVEASMTMSSSKSEKVCARTESIAAPRNGSSLYVANRTVTRGATPLRYRDGCAPAIARIFKREGVTRRREDAKIRRESAWLARRHSHVHHVRCHWQSIAP